VTCNAISIVYANINIPVLLKYLSLNTHYRLITQWPNEKGQNDEEHSTRHYT